MRNKKTNINHKTQQIQQHQQTPNEHRATNNTDTKQSRTLHTKQLIGNQNKTQQHTTNKLHHESCTKLSKTRYWLWLLAEPAPRPPPHAPE